MEPGEFQVVPTVHLQKRRLVRDDGTELPDAPVAKVRELASKGLVCVVDHDGLQRNRADLDTLRKMSEKGNVWADAGSRFATDVMDLVIAGAERVTMRWATLGSEDELIEAHGMTESLYLGMEYHQGAFVKNPLLEGGEERALQLAKQLNAGIVVLDLGRADGGEGPDRGLATRFQGTGLERWYGGGVRSMGEARDLEQMGYTGCLVGTAVLEGTWS